LTWNLHVNASAVTVKLIWIKAEKPIATIGEVASQAPKKKYLFPSTRKRNVHRLNQWKAKSNEAVVDLKVHADAQTDKPTQMTTQHRMTSKAVTTQTTTHHPEYCKRGSGPHIADIISKAGR